MSLTVQWPLAFQVDDDDSRPLLYIHRRPLINGVEDTQGRCQLDNRIINPDRLTERPLEAQALVSKRQAHQPIPMALIGEEEEVRKKIV